MQPAGIFPNADYYFGLTCQQHPTGERCHHFLFFYAEISIPKVHSLEFICTCLKLAVSENCDIFSCDSLSQLSLFNNCEEKKCIKECLNAEEAPTTRSY